MDRNQVAESERIEWIGKMMLDTMRRQNCRKVEDVLVALRRLDKSITTDEIREAIDHLEENNILATSDTNTPRSFLYYIGNFGSNNPFWVTIMTTIIVICAVFAFPQGDFWSISRVVVGGAFIIILPGYCLMRLLFSEKRLNTVEKIVLSIGLSLAIAALAGMVLNYSLLGITIETVVTLVGSINITLAVINAYREFLVKRRVHRLLDATFWQGNP